MPRIRQPQPAGRQIGSSAASVDSAEPSPPLEINWRDLGRAVRQEVERLAHEAARDAARRTAAATDEPRRQEDKQ